MPIDPSAVGATSDPVEASWDSKDALLYAVGVGAGTDELAYTTENTSGVDQQVLPTFCVVIGWGRGMGVMGRIGSFNPAMLVHGQQAVALHKPLPVEGTVRMQGTITGIYDKGSGALVVTETAATDTATDEPLYTTTSSVFIRGEGGFGGERGPSGPRNVPPETEPDHIVESHTSPDQALVYRLSGDRNPLHSDPSFAALGGFDRPILHGLCSYGFAGRALLHTLCAGESGRFTGMEGRFSAPVFPGDTLITRVWRTGEGEAVFTVARTGHGGVVDLPVIDQGRATFTV